MLPSHSLTSTRMVEQLSGSHNLAKMLADYRAKGGRIRQRDGPDSLGSSQAPGSCPGRAGDASIKPPAKDSEEDKLVKHSDMSWAPKVSTLHSALCPHVTGETLLVTCCCSPQLDCLNPVNHQRLCVLFSSSSAQSNNAPNPCVSPW